MAFNVEFHPGTPGESSQDDALPELDGDYEVIIMDVCALLAEADGAQFTLEGFGRGRWPVDVDYDMSVFAEYLPELLECVKSRERMEVDMYSQGIECKLTFVPEEDEVAIHCVSRTDWIPNPDVERVGRADLIEMLERLATNIALGMQAIDLRLVAGEPFDRWIAGAHPSS